MKPSPEVTFQCLVIAASLFVIALIVAKSNQCFDRGLRPVGSGFKIICVQEIP